MPGAPSGRACENCRRRRQKCDYLKPTCSRCARLGVECVGSGERRFVFVDQKFARRQNAGKKSRCQSAESSNPSSSWALTPSPCPSSELDSLSSSFAEMIKPTTDCRYNLVFTYGEFLQSVPQRLGSNKALDGAAQALVVSHRDFSRRQPVSAESLARYSDAIQALTRSLDDPVKSLSLETICAVVLLTMCQNLSGLSLQHLTSHCQGAVQMLGARQSHVMADEFELALHTYLHGPVLVQALFNRTMRLSTSKFEALTRALKFNMDAPGQGTVILLYKLPALLQRGRAMMQGAADRDAFFAELSSMYQALRKASAFVYTKFMKAPGPGPKRTGPYGFCLAFACIFNCMLRGVEPNNTQLQLEAEELVASTIALVPEAQHGRPLAAGHMMLNLSAGWMCTQKENERQMLQDMLSEFSWDFRRDADTMWPTYDLEALYADLQFRTDPEVVLAHNT